MLKIKQSNHHIASLNSTPFYMIPYALPIEKEDILLEVKEKINLKSINLHRKFPWAYVNFEKNKNIYSTVSWKIHISASINNYLDILNEVVDFCLNKELNFKFIASSNGFNVINGKQINPASAGKFIVIYCLNHSIEEILSELDDSLSKYEGPYILSDRQYKNSQVLYYRYGEYLPVSLLAEEGHIENYIFDNKFSLKQDIRKPYYKIFDWVKDIDLSNTVEEYSYLLEKYQIDTIISNRGSMTCYSGFNRLTGEHVFIKEARKLLGLDTARLYSRDRIRKEYIFLKDMKHLNVSAKPIELIEEGGNTYLVEEFIDGKVLTEWLSLNNFLYRSNCSKEEREEFLTKINKVMLGILENFNKVVALDIYINDVSANNILIDEDLNVKFIDFEYAFYKDEKDVAEVYTPGFAADEGLSKLDSEINKLEKIITYLFIPFNNMYILSREKRFDLIKWYLNEYSDFLPNESRILLTKILNKELHSFNEFLNFESNTDTGVEYFMNLKSTSEIIKESIEGIIQSFNSDIIDINNYLFPADPQLYNTNMYSLSHGCFGILYALFKLGKTYDFDYKDIEHRCLEIAMPKLLITKSIPKGLFMGLSGISWALLELGYTEIAESLLIESNNIENIKRFDYFYGLSGILLTNMKFYLETQNEYYKETSKKIYNRLKELNANDISDNSFGEGFSGIALTLSYYSVLFNDLDSLATSKKYLDIELSRCKYDDREKVGINREGEKSDITVFSPYVYDGIAGVGITLIRLYKITKEENYLIQLNKIIESSLFDITLFPTYMRGFSGLMDFLMDTLFVVKDTNMRNKILETLKRLSKNLQLFYNNEEQLFFGEQLFKLSTDLTAGTAGISLTLERYRKLIENRQLIPSDMFYLDKELSIFKETTVNEDFVNFE